MAGTQHSTEYRELLQRLIEARKAAGLSQAELAKTLCKPPSFVAKVELSERRLDVIEFCIWCRAVDADPAALISEEIVKFPSNIPR